MNKLLVMPLLIMMLIILFSTTLGYEVTTHSQDTYEDFTAKMNQSEDGSWKEYEISLQTDDANSAVSVALFNPVAIFGIVIALVAIGIASGIKVLGSGLSALSQEIIFKFGVFYGIWALVSGLSYYLLDRMEIYGGMFWCLLTLTYSIGFTSEIRGSGE